MLASNDHISPWSAAGCGWRGLSLVARECHQHGPRAARAAASSGVVVALQAIAVAAAAQLVDGPTLIGRGNAAGEGIAVTLVAGMLGWRIASRRRVAWDLPKEDPGNTFSGILTSDGHLIDVLHATAVHRSVIKSATWGISIRRCAITSPVPNSGSAWIAGLADRVVELRNRWGLGELGAPYSGGSHSLVAPVVLRDGSRAVLKIPFVDEENLLEAEALRLYGGDGSVQLLAFDQASGAMLLEEASSGTSLEEHPDRTEAIAIVCALLSRLRRPVPSDYGFTLVTDQLRVWMARFETSCADETNRRARHLLAAAGAAAHELSAIPSTAYLVNRDAHLGNVLAARREPWLLIDPKPVVGDPAFDAGYLVDWLIGEVSTPSHTEKMVVAVAAGLRVGENRVRAWALVRAMENYLWASSDGVGDDARPYIETAAALDAIG